MTAATNAPWSIRNAWAAYVPGHWISDALCAETNPEEFFPEKGQSSAVAKTICRSCLVREECGTYAINSPIPLHGVWGGMTAIERRDIRRANNIKDHPEEEHGTEAGAKRHERKGELPCLECRKAASHANKRRREGW